jgi:peptidoglycan/LPS O-acetylase OafA/YrhL
MPAGGPDEPQGGTPIARSFSPVSSRKLQEGLAGSRLPGLDGIRAIAAAMVVVNHHDFTIVSGALGVTAFFVLSGFLITWLLLAEDDRFGSVSLRNFYIRRGLRIFPAFYVYCALVIGLAALTHKALVWPQTIASLLYVNNYYEALRGDLGTPLSHSWSLGIEEQFYVLWPLAFVLLRRNRLRMARALGFTLVAIWIYRAVRVAAGTSPIYVHYAFDTRADHLLVGCLLAVSLRAGLWTRAFDRVTRGASTSIATVLLLVTSVWLGRIFGNGYKQTIGFAVEALLLAMLLVQVIALRDSPLWRWLNSRPLTYLGTISYSVYLYQQIVPGPVMRGLSQAPAVLQLGVSSAIIVALASGSYFIVERPFLALKERFATPREPRPVVVSLSQPVEV